jgi:hypothetical protein
MPEEGGWMRLPDAAVNLGLRAQAVHGLVQTGALRGRRQGSRWYVCIEDVEKLGGRRSEQAAGGAE